MRFLKDIFMLGLRNVSVLKVMRSSELTPTVLLMCSPRVLFSLELLYSCAVFVEQVLQSTLLGKWHLREENLTLLSSDEQ